LLPDCRVAAHTVIVPTQYSNIQGAKGFDMVGVRAI